MQWFDSHAHLQDRAFASDLDAVSRALAAGVTRIILPASITLIRKGLPPPGGTEGKRFGGASLWTSIGAIPMKRQNTARMEQNACAG